MSNDQSVETAWRIHSSLADLIGKIDAKASFALTIESAALGGIVALSGRDHRFGHVTGFLPLASFWLGVLLLGMAALAAVAVVVPRGDGSGDALRWREDFIYYGHLRHWTPEKLAEHLTDTDMDTLAPLSRQLVTMSRIAWTKHRRVRHSLVLAVAGAVLVTLAGLSV